MTSPPVQVTLRRQAISYPIYFAPLKFLPRLLKTHQLQGPTCILLTDEQVATHYLEPVEKVLQQAGWSPISILLPVGETTKSLRSLEHIYDTVLPRRITRQTPFLTLGGGVIGDLGGMAASTLLRGLPLVHLPTTLLAQVDSSIGGKTGINHPAGKNLIGTFYHPRFVLSDVEVLQTLPQREWISGLAEVIKSALLHDAAFVECLRAHWQELLKRSFPGLPEVIRRTAAIKTAIVMEDEQEHGKRVLLNLGHTFAHALEQATSYTYFTHGEAVAIGLRGAAYLSHLLHPSFPLNSVMALLHAFPLPPFPEHLSNEELVEAMQTDKKRTASELRLILMKQPGTAYIASGIPVAHLLEAWAFARNYPGSMV